MSEREYLDTRTGEQFTATDRQLLERGLKTNNGVSWYATNAEARKRRPWDLARAYFEKTREMARKGEIG